MQFQESTYPQILSFTFLQHNISGAEVPTLLLFGFSGMEHSHIWVSIPIFPMYLSAILEKDTIFYFSETRDLSAWAYVPFPLHTNFPDETVHFFTYDYAENILVQFYWNFTWCLLCTDVLYLWILSYGIIISFYHVHQSLYIYLQPSEIHLYFDQCYNNLNCPYSIIAVLCILFVTLSPFVLQKLRFSEKSLLFHSHYPHQDVMKLVCSANSVNTIYKLFLALTAILDLLCISVFLHAYPENYSMHCLTVRPPWDYQHFHPSHSCCVHLLCAYHHLGCPSPLCQNVSPAIGVIIDDTFLLVSF